VFQRGGTELRVVDLDTKRDRMLTRAQVDRVPFTAKGSVVWSPDGRWIAYVDQKARGFSNVYAVPAAGGESRQVTFLANVSGNAISWSPDGTYLIYNSDQRTEDPQLARVDLVLRTPRFREDQFRELFRVDTRNPAQPTPAQPTPAQPGPSTPAPLPAADSTRRATPADSTAARPNPRQGASGNAQGYHDSI